MVCYFPMKGYRSRNRTKNGKYPVTFSTADAYIDQPVTIPCGYCLGCRLERSRMWAIRCVHEAQMHDANCFITLTYSDDNLPAYGSLEPRDFVLFMKKLRKKFSDIKIRYFQAGEYGEKLSRPHFHACIFGFDFPDKVLWSVRSNVRLYRSEILEKLWPYGFSTIGDVTFESAAYVARYCMKKVNGDAKFEHYIDVDKETGEVLSMKHPEYVTMSRRPGIAYDWVKKFGNSDVYPEDFVVIRNGLKIKPPRYYDSIYDDVLQGDLKHVKILRRVSANSRKEDNSSSRLEVRRICKEFQVNMLKRSFENG